MTVSAINEAILAMEKRRQLYSTVCIVMLLAILISGYKLANDMNSGSFFRGLTQFLIIPARLSLKPGRPGSVFCVAGPVSAGPFGNTEHRGRASLIGGGLAVVLAFLGSGNLGVKPAFIIPLVRRIMDSMRAFPELIIALFLIFVLGSSPVPAMIAVAFHTAGALGKLFSEVNENMEQAPIEGLASCGASWIQRMRYGALSQVLPNYLSYFMLRFEINVRASAILGFVGAGGIGTELRRTIGWGKGAGDETAALFVLLILSIFIIDQTSSFLRRRLVTGREA